MSRLRHQQQMLIATGTVINEPCLLLRSQYIWLLERHEIPHVRSEINFANFPFM